MPAITLRQHNSLINSFVHLALFAAAFQDILSPTVSVQVLVALSVLSSLFVSALTAERDHTEQRIRSRKTALRELERRLDSLYSIMKKHDGVISVESEPGEGSVFHVYLPVSDGMPPAEASIATATVDGISSHRHCLCSGRAEQVSEEIENRWILPFVRHALTIVLREGVATLAPIVEKIWCVFALQLW